MPKLSVIVPCFNVQEFVPDTLRSLSRNAGPDTEFLLVDDRSTDGTGDLLERAAPDIPRSRVLRHEVNRGISQARNTGIDAARGDYLTFLDGDDWYAPGYLDELLAAAQRLDCDFVRTDHVQASGRTRSVQRAPAPRRGVVLSPRDAIGPATMKTMVDYPFVWAGVYRRSLFDDGFRFEPRLRTAEDRVFTWQLHLRAETFATVGLHGVFYRRGVGTSLTQIGDERQLDFIPAHDRILEEVAAHPEADRFLPKIVRTYCAMIAFHMSGSTRYDAETTRKLRGEASAALRRMPSDVLEAVLSVLDEKRAVVLRRLRGRGTGKAA
ncbi:glycosyltransferase family 2 protein [Streptomyces sp. JJ38]|uniref:glycosyltransferase family 2 protein n=1 Tax=Streptomyces sp. JJ38 TaxID=2738128 RepID=UPI001C568A27|nr:glycosyltransferase family 2 protein [Streptomyces sp. JJ38]MBW1595788.1 glycosyltransferase family 2 protein [Streptomyces sp. JJ38]